MKLFLEIIVGLAFFIPLIMGGLGILGLFIEYMTIQFPAKSDVKTFEITIEDISKKDNSIKRDNRGKNVNLEDIDNKKILIVAPQSPNRCDNSSNLFSLSSRDKGGDA
ncbi:MAG: hypothetical protein K2K93_07900 [Muribaculaceae bacterium]|nr:hypothetical protein [Muribaculaceae bacterium]